MVSSAYLRLLIFGNLDPDNSCHKMELMALLPQESCHPCFLEAEEVSVSAVLRGEVSFPSLLKNMQNVRGFHAGPVCPQSRLAHLALPCVPEGDPNGFTVITAWAAG